MTQQLLTEKFTNYLKSKAHTKRSIASRINIIKRFWKWLEQQDIEAENVSYNDLLAFIKKSSKKASQRTIQNYLGAIKHFYEYLIQTGIITSNPTTDIEIKGVKRNQLYHILEPHELNQLYHEYKAETSSKQASLSEQRNKVILGLVVYQGLRTTELGKLEVTDINMREGKIEIPQSRKNNHRTLSLEAHQIMDFYNYLQEVRPALLTQAPKTTTTLFINTSTSTNFILIMRGIISRVKKINPQASSINQIRASVITKWLKRYNLRETQYKAGHRYISSTESFLQNDIEGLQEEVQMFQPFG